METINVVNGSEIALSATDTSGVAATYYSLDGSYPTTLYTTPISITNDCILRYYSVDTLGNTEIDTTLDIKVLAPSIQTPPSILHGVASIEGTDDFLAVGEDGIIYKSKAGGSWKPVYNTGNTSVGGGGVIHVPDTTAVLVGTCAGVFKSENYGNADSFTKVRTNSPIFTSFESCAWNNISKTCVFTGWNGAAVSFIWNIGVGIFTSWGQGAPTGGTGAGGDLRYTAHPTTSGTTAWWYANNSSVGIKSPTLTFTGYKSHGKTILNAQILPYDANVAYLVGIEAGKLVVYKTSNAFTTMAGLYVSESTSMTLSNDKCVYYNPTTGLMIIAACKNGRACIMRSVDHGVTWIEEYADRVDSTTPNGIAVSTNSVVVVGPRSYKSLDSGDSWPSI